MCLQKSNLFTAIFLWRRVACSLLAALRFVSPWHPRCPVLKALCTRPLSIFSCLLFSPAVFIFSFLFVPLDCSADPSFWGALFPNTGGVGRQQQRMAAVSEFVESSCQLCRSESHSGASLSRFSSLASFSSFSLLFLHIRLFATLPPFPHLYCFFFIPFFY